MNKPSIQPPRPLVWAGLSSTSLAVLWLSGAVPTITAVIAALVPAQSVVAVALASPSHAQWLDDPITSLLATFVQLCINLWVVVQVGWLAEWVAAKAFARWGVHGPEVDTAAADPGLQYTPEPEFITVVIQMPPDKAKRAELVGHFNFEHGDFMGGRVTAMCIGDGISKLEELGY